MGFSEAGTRAPAGAGVDLVSWKPLVEKSLLILNNIKMKNQNRKPQKSIVEVFGEVAFGAKKKRAAHKTKKDLLREQWLSDASDLVNRIPKVIEAFKEKLPPELQDMPKINIGRKKLAGYNDGKFQTNINPEFISFLVNKGASLGLVG